MKPVMIPMIPCELEGRDASLAATNDFSIVIITGAGVRHRRFALRLIEEFGDLVVGWFQCDASTPRKFTKSQAVAASPVSLKARLLQFVREGIPFARNKNRLSQLIAVLRVAYFRYSWRKYLDSYKKVEKKLFDTEVQRLQARLQRTPEIIHPSDVNSPEFVERLKTLNPYFLLTLAGPLYSSEVLKVPRGLPINQHAGHSPVLKGSNTVEWALYRHQLEYVSSTVHVTTSGADAGPILRRSNPCILPGDDSASVFCRVVALGTELVVEVVRDIINGKSIRLFPQPSSVGTTYLGRDVAPHILTALKRDKRAEWLRDELTRLRNNW